MLVVKKPPSTSLHLSPQEDALSIAEMRDEMKKSRRATNRRAEGACPHDLLGRLHSSTLVSPGDSLTANSASSPLKDTACASSLPSLPSSSSSSSQSHTDEIMTTTSSWVPVPSQERQAYLRRQPIQRLVHVVRSNARDRQRRERHGDGNDVLIAYVAQVSRR